MVNESFFQKGVTELVSMDTCTVWCKNQDHLFRAIELEPLWFILVSFFMLIGYKLYYVYGTKDLHKATTEAAMLYISIILQAAFLLYNLAK